MKVHVEFGRGFQGIADYAMRLEKMTGPMLSTNMDGRSPRDLAHEFERVRSLRPDIDEPVLHMSMSAADGERLTDKQWDQAIRSELAGIGLDPDRHQFFAVRHGDTAHDHTHIIASMISVEGKSASRSWFIRRAIATSREIEKRMGLIIVTDRDGNRPRGLSIGEMGLARATGNPPARLVLQRALDAAMADCPSFGVFIQRLEAVGVNALLNGKSGQVSGISFKLACPLKGQTAPFKGSALGRGYRWAAVAVAVHYDQVRDADFVAWLRGAGSTPAATKIPPAVCLDRGLGFTITQTS